MFKRSEKKIKAVFKMQFQATQVPQLKAKSLMLSLVPVGAGKPSVKLAKSPIIDGTCTWENPIYETVRLIMETKTGIIREKFYYLIVSTGSSKSGFLGEVSIDFADLAAATKPLTLTLPLQTSKSGAVLHVAVQKMTGDSDSRCTEDNEGPTAESYDSEDSSEASNHLNERHGSFNDSESDNFEAKSRNSVKETSNDTSGNFANQIKMLERKVEFSEIEVQSLRQQIIKEGKRGQQLSDQIICLKEERDALKDECEKLKVSSHGKNETENSKNIPEELQREKNLIKKLKSQLYKSEDSNSEFVLALRDLNKKMEQKNAEISRLSAKNGYSDEAEKLKEKIEELCSEIEFHKKEKEELQLEVEGVNLKYENLEAENKEIHSKLQENQKEKMEMQHSCTEYLETIQQLKSRVANLEGKIKGREFQHSESLDLIDHLEIQVENLQKELENQAQEFEHDLNELTNAKVEQEQRAIRAEEAFRKTKRNNANAAERLQEEFEKISDDMSLQIEENQKIAQKAEKEANDLRQENEILQGLVKKIEEEHEQILQEQKRGIVLEDNKSMVWMKEKEDMERELELLRNKAEKLGQENVSIKALMDQKKSKEENLHLEVKKLRLKNNEVKNQLLEMETEKENLKKEVSKLQKQGLEASAALQNSKGKEKNGKSTSVDRSVRNKIDKTQTKREAIDQTSVLLSEVASLKEQNKSMEEGLKEMHEKYSEVSLRFAEVEGERQQLVMTLRNMKNGKKN